MCPGPFLRPEESGPVSAATKNAESGIGKSKYLFSIKFRRKTESAAFQ